MSTRHRNVKYQCPACGYSTSKKTSMQNHLYHRKKHCPKSLNDIELTDEIKRCVIENRVYRPPPPPVAPVSSTVIINNNQQINNYIKKININEKLETYADHAKIELIDFSDKIESEYANRFNKLNKDDFKYGLPALKSGDYLELFDKATIAVHKDFKDFNVIYDDKLNKISIYDSGSWDAHLVDKGLSRMLEVIQDAYLDAYECYLIRKSRDARTPARQKQEMTEHLNCYYKFITCFDMKPFVFGKSDGQILSYPNGSVDHSYSIEDEHMRRFQEIEDDIKRSEVTKTKRDVLDIIKRNSKNTIDEFNKKVASMIQMDEGFKSRILSLAA